jgi:hypothetical protein
VRGTAATSHSFTHFRLHIQPIQVQLAPRQTTLPGQIWLSPIDALDAALPAPVRKLVAQLEALSIGALSQAPLAADPQCAWRRWPTCSG